MSEIQQFYKFIIDLVQTCLNYGPLGLAMALLAKDFYILKNFDLKRRGK